MSFGLLLVFRFLSGSWLSVSVLPAKYTSQRFSATRMTYTRDLKTDYHLKNKTLKNP
jgi:hypothetical protein